jgi:hypothetical protein
MRKVALADTLAEWDLILAQMDKHPELQTPQFRELREALAATAEMTRRLALEQQNLEGLRRAVTQQLRITRGEGQDLVIKIQSAAKSCFGHRWKGLALFRMRPIQGRSDSLSQVFGDGQLPVEDIRKAAVQAAQPSAPDPESASREEG